MFQQINAHEMKDNLIQLISKEWMLISAGNEQGYNMMTASWGFAGEMWGEDAVVIAVRPQRHTLKFLQENDTFTLSFYGDNKEVHKVCGSMSGRDVDKTALTGLSPVFEDGTVYFEQARLVLVCKKQYVQQLDKNLFIDQSPLTWYPDNDFHYMIIGKIEKVLEKI